MQAINLCLMYCYRVFVHNTLFRASEPGASSKTSRKGFFYFLTVFALIVTFVLPAAGQMQRQPDRSIMDEQIIRDAQLVVSGEYIEVYQYKMNIDPAFLRISEDAYKQIERLLGAKIDTETLGPKVKIYVADFPSVCHVWKGYNHPQDPKGIIFINRKAYLGAMNGLNATYIHELVHLFTWRYQSHTLREGLAEYIALKVLPAGIGASPVGSNLTKAIPGDVIEYLGTTRPPPYWIGTDQAKRWIYYSASYRFVKYLIETNGMETFLKLYYSKKPDTEIEMLYGLTREQAIKASGVGSE